MLIIPYSESSLLFTYLLIQWKKTEPLWEVDLSITVRVEVKNFDKLVGAY